MNDCGECPGCRLQREYDEALELLADPETHQKGVAAIAELFSGWWLSTRARQGIEMKHIPVRAASIHANRLWKLLQSDHYVLSEASINRFIEGMAPDMREPFVAELKEILGADPDEHPAVTFNRLPRDV